MATFNEAELVLLEHWSDARLLDDAMKAVRNKYAEKVDAALAEFQKDHPEFEYVERRMFGTGGWIVIAKNAWFHKADTWPSGFWIEDLRLDSLTSQERPGHFKSVVIHDPRVDLNKAEARLRKYADKILTSDESRKLDWEPQRAHGSLSCRLEQTGKVLLELLVKDESRGFVDCLRDHLEWLAKFTVVVDEICPSGKRVRK